MAAFEGRSWAKNGTFGFAETEAWPPLVSRPANIPPAALLYLPHVLLLVALLLPPPILDSRRKEKMENKPSVVNYRTTILLPIILGLNALLILGFGQPSTLDHVPPPLSQLLRPYFKGYTTTEPFGDYLIGTLAFWISLRAVDILGIVRSPELIHHRIGWYASQTPHGTLLQKISWIISLVYCHRGIGWDWGRHGHVPPRTHAQAPPGARNRAFIVRRLKRFAWYYLLNDAASVWMQSRPYFKSAGRAPNAHHIHSEPDLILRMVDMAAASMAAIGMELQYLNVTITIFLLERIYTYSKRLVGLATARDDLVAQQEGYDPEDIWPHMFGSFSEAYSLRRLFGKVWHQMVRRPLSAIPKPLASALRYYLSLPPEAEPLLRQSFAFVLSGIMHAANAWTMCNQGLGALQFFSTLAVGATIESLAEWTYRSLASPRQLAKTLPKGQSAALWVRCVGYVWTLGWMWGTMGPLIDEFVWGGLWDKEPIPFSIIRGLWMGKWYNY